MNIFQRTRKNGNRSRAMRVIVDSPTIICLRTIKEELIQVRWFSIGNVCDTQSSMFLANDATSRLECDICGQTFAWRNSLNGHMKTHAGVFDTVLFITK